MRLAEARSDAEGRFRVARLARPGLSLWPLFRSEAWVVAVLREGYRCPLPRTVPASGELRLALAPALDLDEQQASCRPVAAGRGQAEASLDPESGLPRDRLVVTGPAGDRHSLSLPGETCGPPGRFGRPHYRIAADGRTALDLRFVDAGCEALRIDLSNVAPPTPHLGGAPVPALKPL